MATTKLKRSLWKNPFIALMLLIFGLWVYWYLKIETHMNSDYESMTEIITDTKNKTDGKKSSRLMREIEILKRDNSAMQTANDSIYKMNLLLNEIDSLNKKIWSLEDDHKQNLLQKHQLLQKLQLLQTTHNNSIHYFLYGFCTNNIKHDQQLYVIMDDLLHHAQNTYAHWMILNISIEQFLISTNFSYTHQKLLQFTQKVIPNINITHDKFQWLFDPHCRPYYNNIKTYYAQNVSDTITLQLPPNIYQYYNISAHNKYGYIDDNERERFSHIIHINHHEYRNKYTNKSYNLHIPNADRVLNIWQNNSYYSSDTQFALSLSNHRPFLMEGSGEAFDAWTIRKHHDCQQSDLHIQRTASWPRRGCIVATYIQGILQRDVHYRFKNYETQLNYNRLLVNQNEKVHHLYIDAVLRQKTHFCSFTVKSFMMFGTYLADALVRHIVHHMISTQHKYCDMLGAYHHKHQLQDKHVLCNRHNPKYKRLWKIGHHLLGECQKPFKFSINMENTASYGYTSEKIYTGLIANTIPIYFGNKDIEKIVNKERIIFCDIEDEILIKKREEYHAFYKELRTKHHIYGDISKNETARHIVKESVFDWALSNFAPHLQSCVDEVIRVDTNDTLYRYKLSQPMIPNNAFANSHYDGSIVSKTIIDTLEYLKSPLFE